MQWGLFQWQPVRNCFHANLLPPAFFVVIQHRKQLLIHSALLKLHSLSSNGRRRGRKGYGPVKGSGDQMAHGGGSLAQCVAVMFPTHESSRLQETASSTA